MNTESEHSPVSNAPCVTRKVKRRVDELLTKGDIIRIGHFIFTVHTVGKNVATIKLVK